MPKHPKPTLPSEIIEQKIYLIRGHKVMVDRDLALLYEVPTGALNQAVRRNLHRFPADFMFQLRAQEFENWKSQIVISNPRAKMGIRRRPYAFTEMGVAMLSSVLKSETAIEVNIGIMRTFTKIRTLLGSHADLIRRLNKLEEEYDENFRVIFRAIHNILNEPVPPKRRIGFNVPEEN